MSGSTRIIRRIGEAIALLAALQVGLTTAGGQSKNSNNDVPGALAGIHLIAPAAAGQWTMPAGDYGNTRFSPLNQINTGNVQNLHIVASMSTGIPHGHEGQPLAVNNTLYIVTPFPNNLIALDMTKPGFPQKWVYHPNPNNQAVGIACCDVVNRGASYADRKIIYNTLDDLARRPQWPRPW
jgi:glucose dehydrogenase